jgi:hypothetical protein
MACSPINPIGCVTDGAGAVVSGAAGGAIDKLMQSIQTAVGNSIASMGTLWVNIGTPNLTGGDTTTIGSTPPGQQGIETVLGWVVWVSLGICVLSLMVAGVRMALPHRHAEAGEDIARIGRTLIAVILISGASTLVGAFMKSRPSDRGASTTVGFIQNGLWYYVLALAVLSIIIGGAKMAWEQRADPGKELVASLIRLGLISSAAVPVIGILVASSDAFAKWIIVESLDCSGTTCFGERVGEWLTFATATGTPAMGVFLTIVLGFIALLASLIQMMLMVARGAMLVLLTGVLPLSAAMTNTESGRGWFKKNLGWLIAFLLYKPAAAIVYATAFQLMGTDIFKDDDKGIVSALAGVMLMIIAIVALPALMKFVTPAVGAVAGAGSGAMTAAMVAAPASGAVSALGRVGSSSGGGSSGGGGGAPQASGSAMPTGGSGSQGSAGTAGKAGASGPTGAGAAGGGTAGGGAAAGGAAASGAAAAATGGATLAVTAAQGAAQAAQGAAGAVTQAAQGAAPSEGGQG